MIAWLLDPYGGNLISVHEAKLLTNSQCIILDEFNQVQKDAITYNTLKKKRKKANKTQ